MRLSIIICSIITASSYIFAPPKKDNSKSVLSKSKQEKKVKKNNDDDLLDGILSNPVHQEAVRKAEQEASYKQTNNDQAVKDFFKAIVAGDVPLCQSLLDKGLDINVVDEDKNSALHHVILARSIFDKINISCCLVDKDKNMTFPNAIARFGLSNEKHVEMIDFLLAHGANANLLNNQKITPLMIAAEENKEEFLLKLIASDVHVNAQNLKGHSALFCAAYHNHLSCIKMLLKAGAKDLQNKQGFTGLMIAIQKRYIEAAQMLINEADDCDLNKKNVNSNAALHLAVNLTLLPIVESLLARNVDCNVQDKDGDTPLMYIFQGKEEVLDYDAKNIATMLLLHGADPTLTHSRTCHALAYAKKHKQDELAQLIRKCGCEKIEEKNKAILLQKSFQTLVDHRNYKRTERLEKKRIEDASACQALEQKNKIVTLRECYRKLFDYRRNLPPDSIPNKIWADLRDDDDEQRFLNRDE